MRALACLTALSMTACGSTGSPTNTAASAPSPDQMKAAIVAARSSHFKDPESIRDARIGPPWSCLVWTACVCFEINAKNGFGGYTGVQPHVAMFSGTSIAGIREGSYTDQCSSMLPFPEMNGGYVPPAPQAAPPPPSQARKR